MPKRDMSDRCLPEIRARAVRIALEHQGSGEAQAGAIVATAPQIGCIHLTLREWVMQAENDIGMRCGVTSRDGGRDRIKAPERQNQQFRQANEMLRKSGPVKAPLIQAHWRPRILRRRDLMAH